MPGLPAEGRSSAAVVVGAAVGNRLLAGCLGNRSEFGLRVRILAILLYLPCRRDVLLCGSQGSGGPVRYPVACPVTVAVDEEVVLCSLAVGYSLVNRIHRASYRCWMG